MPYTECIRHEKQILLISCLTYLGSRCVSSIRPKKAISFMVGVYITHHCLQPFFADFFQNFKEHPLGKNITQLSLCFAAILTSKGICYLTAGSVSFKEIGKITGIFLACYFIAGVVYGRLEQALLNPVKS